MVKTALSICIGALISGQRPCITEREYAQLKGCSPSKLQRDRWQGKGIPFQKDDRGRVYYLAEDVLADLQRKTHRSTSEYDTSLQVARLLKARSVLKVVNDDTKS